jgi:hypothetical protein
MTITSVTKIQFFPMTEGEFAAADAGQAIFLTDTARIVVGADPTHGNPYHIRAADKENRFPFEAIEVLTEASPRVRELYGLNIRNTDQAAALAPVVIPAGETVPAAYAYVYGGQAIPISFTGNMSATFEYHAFSGGSPAQTGLLRLLGGSSPVFATSGDVGTSLTFTLESMGDTCTIMCTNNSADPVRLIVRATIIIPTLSEGGPPVSTDQPPVWGTTAGPLGEYDASVTIQFQASDPEGEPVTFAVSNGTSIPNGLTLSSDGLMLGTVVRTSVEVINHFTLSASDGVNTVYRDFTLTVPAAVVQNLPPVWQSPTAGNLGSFTQNQPLSIALFASDPEGQNVTYVSAFTTGVEAPFSSIIPGLTLDPGTATISGTPTTSSSYNFRIYASDPAGNRTSRDFSLTVGAQNLPAVWTTTAGGLGSFVEGSAVSVQVTATDPEGLVISYSSPDLPSGLTLNASTGAITGTAPAVSGTSTLSFTVNAVDNSGVPVGRQFSITVLDTASLPNCPSTYADMTITGRLLGQEPHQNLPGFGSGTVWGTATYGYTNDSNMSAAAVHAGLLQVGETGVIRFALTNPVYKTNYPSSTAHGVTTTPWETGWCGVTLSRIS